jgi:RNA polymerase subunit RPABC4/transcription elongation factor Spt4
MSEAKQMKGKSMSNLVECKTCKHKVDKSAKSCPSCGAKNPGMTWKEHLATAVFLIVITLIIMKACSSDDESVTPAVSQAQVDVSQAKDYQVISSEDFSFTGRKRIQINIAAPDATSYEELAQTAIKAALDFQKQQNANVVYIFLGDDIEMINNGDALAIARYSPDGGGNSGDQGWTWEVEAFSSKKIIIDDKRKQYILN